MPHKFAATPEAQADLKAFNAKLYGPMLGEIDAMARKAADEGKPYLAGEHFGPLDAYALTLLRWGGFAGSTRRALPACGRWCSALRCFRRWSGRSSASGCS